MALITNQQCLDDFWSGLDGQGHGIDGQGRPHSTQASVKDQLGKNFDDMWPDQNWQQVQQDLTSKHNISSYYLFPAFSVLI